MHNIIFMPELDRKFTDNILRLLWRILSLDGSSVISRNIADLVIMRIARH